MNYVSNQIRAVLVPESENPVDHTTVVTAMGVKFPALRVESGSWGWASKITFGVRVAVTV